MPGQEQANRSGSAAHSQQFPSTLWELVEQAHEPNEAAGSAALATLLEQYLPPLRVYLRVGWKMNEHEIDDLLQGFVNDKMLEQNLVAQADRARGRFRSFLLKALQHYVISQRRRERVRATLPLEEQLTDTAEMRTAERAFEEAWARETVHQALERMRVECEAQGRSEVWEVFRQRVAEPMLTGVDPAPYAALIEQYGLQSPAQASNLLITAKRHYVRCLHAAVGDHVADSDQIPEEIEHLREILARSSA